MTEHKFLALLVVTVFLVSGCNQIFPSPTPTPLPTNTPTLTPTPTFTPTLTSTPTPTFTPTPNGQVINLLGMNLLAPPDWLVEREEKESQTNVDIKEPESGVTMQLMSIKMEEMDDPSQCSMEFMQPLLKETFKQMIKELKTAEMKDLALRDGTVIPRSALVGTIMELFTFRIEIGVLQHNEICYTVFLSGEESKLADNQDIIDEIYQSIEFVDWD